MQFNYDFEIAALLFMTVILLHFIFVRQFPSDKVRDYRMLFCVCWAECVFNIASSIGLANSGIVPEFVNEVFAFAFFSLEGLSSFFIFRYLVTVGELSGKERKGAMIFGILPFAFFEVMVFLNPVTRFFYYFENYAYHAGSGTNFGFIYIVYFFLLNIVLVFWKRKTVGFRNFTIILVYTVSAISVILVQFHIRGILLTSTGNGIMILMVYLAMQNPVEMLDPVTGVGNERAFMQQMKNILSHKSEAVIITVDIRQFHHINTVLGYENCNKILKEIGSYLYQTGGKFHVFHNSGDIFTVIADTPKAGQELIEKIGNRMQEEWAIQQIHVVLNAVMAVLHYPRDFSTIPDFMGMREYLLEMAKAAEHQAVLEADEIFIKSYHRRIAVELAVEKAIQEEAFEVYYQPIFSVKEHRIVSLEALVRLLDSKLGFIPPDEFIPIAEKNGSIIQIGSQVLEESCRFLAKHVLPNPSLGIETVHVNIAAAQCLCQNLVETILPVLEKHHIPPSMITLEVTERTAISTPELMRRHMKELGDLGISFSMDDYGSGHSNCSYLIQFPFREVKIDKEIVWAGFETESARVLLESEIKTIRKLGLPLVIEGIEKKEQSEVMERLGVDCIQGYYYGRPLPEKECIRYIRSFNLSLEEYGK